MVRRYEGRVSGRALRIPDGPTTLAVIRRAEDRLSELGFETVLRCETEQCGGFAFRSAIDVFDQPAMAVNLADFRQLTLRRRDGGETLVSILASRFRDETLIQTVVIEDARPARLVSAPPAENAEADAVDEPPPEATTRSVPPEPSGATASAAEEEPFGDALLSTLRREGAATLEGVDFEPGGVGLTAGSEAAIARAAEVLAAAPDLALVVVGHTDATGSLEINRRVSAQRAAAVRDALIAAGVSAGRLSAEGVGYLAPRDSNATEAGRRRNRRVELVALPD